MSSVIEPETSIRQNITAWALGSRRRPRSGCSAGRPDRCRRCAATCARSAPRSRAFSSTSFARRLRLQLGARPPARRSRPPAPPSRPTSAGRARSAAPGCWRMVRTRLRLDGAPLATVARAVTAHGLGVLQLGLGHVRQLQLLEEHVQVLIGADGEAEIVLALAVGRALRALVRLARTWAWAGCRRARTPCCRATPARGRRPGAHGAAAARRSASSGSRRLPCSRRRPAPLADRADHRLLDRLLGQPDEPLPVGQALAARGSAADR